MITHRKHKVDSVSRNGQRGDSKSQKDLVDDRSSTHRSIKTMPLLIRCTARAICAGCQLLARGAGASRTRLDHELIAGN